MALLMAPLLVVAVSGRAQAADVDFAILGLVGSGVDSGDAANNPYVLQLGAAGELTINGFLFGIRGTRSIGSRVDCSTPCRQVDDLRTFGADLGFDWELLMLHLSPRFGIGRLKERDGDNVAAYLEPGAVVDLELGLLALGAELRYRVAIDTPDASGLLAYLRAGLRF
jgi:hypothetical protein